MNNLTGEIISAAIEVHRTLGPGLLESVYEKALAKELNIRGLSVETQKPVDVIYKGVKVADDLRLDMIVEDKVIVELKSVEELKNVHYKQLQTYLRLLDKSVGLLINFNVLYLKDGIHRVVNNYRE